jgi:hypothetical protein
MPSSRKPERHHVVVHKKNRQAVAYPVMNQANDRKLQADILVAFQNAKQVSAEVLVMRDLVMTEKYPV